MKKLTLFILALFVLSGCSSFGTRDTVTDSDFGSTDAPKMMEESYEMAADSVERKMDSSLVINGGGVVEGVEQKVIKTGSLALHMESVQDGVAAIQSNVKLWGGEVSASNVNRYENAYVANMTVKVPSAQFDTALAGLKALAVYVDSESTNASNVTEAYMDLEARLSNAKEAEVQYLAILDRATTVEEILQVTDYLSAVRYEIESIEGQLKYYDSTVDYSTIELYLTEDESVQAVQETWRPLSTLREALSNWAVFLQDLADSAIYLLIFGWPLILVGIALWIWRRGRGKKRK
ncbi:MAG: DUF4349 domain-containing protein [Candidatus Gracilibacteria bacterium]